MTANHFSKVLRSSQWLHAVTFGGLALALLLMVALFWGGQRILEQEREKIGLEFYALTTHLTTQTRFLQDLQARNRVLDLPAMQPGVEHGTDIAAPDGRPVFQVRTFQADVPYDMFCVVSKDCSLAQLQASAQDGAWHAVGDYLAGFYANRWSRSYFPGATTLLMDGVTPLGLIVPGFDAESPSAQFSLADILAMSDSMRARLQQHPDAQQVHWVPLPGLASNAMAGFIDASLPPGVWPSASDAATPVYAVTLFGQQRINLFQKVSDVPVYDDFWLRRGADPPLLGEGAPPGSGKAGTQISLTGVVLTLVDASQTWTGIYRIGYGTLFQANLWLLSVAVCLLVLFLAGATLYLRWYERRVMLPAQLAHQDLVESEAFNRTMLDTAPVALCVLGRDQGEVVFCNALAQEWLGLQAGDGAQRVPPGVLPNAMLRAETPGAQDNLALHGRILQAAYAPTRYHQQKVVLCAFVDVSARAEYEQALARARAEADSANAAKTRFLAAVSHEVRTPLYGILGTMELLAMTPLSGMQRQHLLRLQQSSGILMQLISDILDVTKIEAGQLALSCAPFDPRELLQTCADTYAAAAQQKGLILFSCVQTDVPACVAGDVHRIRQVISNFLSNALKFTSSGQIVARLRCQASEPGMVTLVFQVTDSGIGISAADQRKLFIPFSQGGDAAQMVQGTGLGLSICASLAKLMGGAVQLTSEQGLGSSFSLVVSLPTASDAQGVSPPDLSGLRVLLRSPHAELSQNLCQWLRFWGADAAPVTGADCPPGAVDDVLLDILAARPERPPGWLGHYLQAGLGPAPQGQDHAFIQGYGPADIARGLLAHLRGQVQSAAWWTGPGHGAGRTEALGLRVLVAEDNPINQATLQDQLEQLGCRVTVVPDGREAFNRWDDALFDVVLSDVNMPHMNGYELAQALRARGVGIPIIGVTANAMRDEEQRCKAAGMTSWIVKPMDLTTLYAHLRVVPSRASGVAGGAPPEPVAAAAVDPVMAEPAIGQDGGQAQDERQSMVQELGEVPEKYRDLFRDTMSADARALMQAAQARDVAAVRRCLHRMHGALLTMKQRRLAKRVQSAQDALPEGGQDADCALALALAQDLLSLIDQM